jgi:hypothetical protein
MTRSTWLAIAAILYAIFGLGLLIAPAPFMEMYGVALDASGQLMARILGSALASLSLMFWLYRARGAESVRPVLVTSFLYNAVDFFVVLAAVLAGTMNGMGWGPVVLHAFLAAGFGYFALQHRNGTRHSTGEKSGRLQRDFERRQVSEIGLGLRARRVVPGVGDVFLRVLDALGEIGAVDVRDGNRGLGEQRATGGQDVGEPAKHDVAFLRAGGRRHGDDARLDGGHHRRVVGHDGHLAFRARNDDGLDLFRDEQPLRRDEFEFEGCCHVDLANSE